MLKKALTLSRKKILSVIKRFSTRKSAKALKQKKQTTLDEQVLVCNESPLINKSNCANVDGTNGNCYSDCQQRKYSYVYSYLNSYSYDSCRVCPVEVVSISCRDSPDFDTRSVDTYSTYMDNVNDDIDDDEVESYSNSFNSIRFMEQDNFRNENIENEMIVN